MDEITLTNAHGVQVRAITYGGIIVSVRVPDRTGQLGDVVLGHDSLAGYLRASAYFGAIIGRYANRIAHARFALGGTTYLLTANEGSHSLHGGVTGFDKALWGAATFKSVDAAGVALTHLSPDGDQGYPGRLETHVTYTLTDRNELVVEYLATTDAPTPVNLTQHSYFNLAGEGTGDVLGHELWINAEQYTPVDATRIPTGSLASVAGTPFDFRTPAPIGSRIGLDDEQLRRGRGYDHNFVLSRAGPGLVHAARARDPASGRTLDVLTTEPGLQLYSGNHFDGSVAGKAGRRYERQCALCLETQHFPDSPNRPDFPSTILRPGSEFRSKTAFVFGTDLRDMTMSPE